MQLQPAKRRREEQEDDWVDEFVVGSGTADPAEDDWRAEMRSITGYDPSRSAALCQRACRCKLMGIHVVRSLICYHAWQSVLRDLCCASATCLAKPRVPREGLGEVTAANCVLLAERKG